MAELADEWPSLAPIRTSCSSRSSSYFYYEPNTVHTHNSINSSNHHSSFQSPPSSSSSHVSFLHSSTSFNHKTNSFLSKCFPPRPNSTSHGFPKQCITASPGRRSHGGAAIFRSVASFPGQDCRLGLTICGVAPANATHSAPLKNNACKSHLANMNAFTMIPANVVGKKKPPDYFSDEPTSPEVTCIGRVRRSKHSKSTWDALLNSSEKLCKKQKAPRKQIEFNSARRNLDHDLQLAYIPRPLSIASSGATSKWRKMVSLFKDIKGLHSPYVQRKLRQEELVIDLSQLRAARSAADRCFDDRINEREMRDVGSGILYICQAGEGEEDSSISHEEGGNDLKDADTPLAHPNCLHLMRNMSGRSKVFHNHDDNSGGEEEPDPLALKVICPSADQKKCNKKQASSFWKSRKLIFSSSRTNVTT